MTADGCYDLRYFAEDRRSQSFYGHVFTGIRELRSRQNLFSDDPPSFLQDGRTGLHVAAASAYHDVVKVLLYHKCTVDARDHDGITPLYLATYHGNYEVMKMLVGAFANVNAVTKVILYFSPPLEISDFDFSLPLWVG